MIIGEATAAALSEIGNRQSAKPLCTADMRVRSVNFSRSGGARAGTTTAPPPSVVSWRYAMEITHWWASVEHKSGRRRMRTC
jgi:hypothetical protein